MAVKYQEQLNPWVIQQAVSDLQPVSIVARFRRRNDAEAYLKIMQRVKPNEQFSIVLDMSKN